MIRGLSGLPERFCEVFMKARAGKMALCLALVITLSNAGAGGHGE